MYQGVPSTPLLRQLSYIMPYVYFNIYFTPSLYNDKEQNSTNLVP